MIGKTIGEYRILEKRGEGGMGMFYKAVDLHLDRIVGLKTLRAEFMAEPELLERLQAEAKTLAHLDHQNIAHLYHYLVVEGQPFIVMEYVDGQDLGEKARAEGLLPLPVLADLTSQVCSAIDYAHGKNVIHRDIKPSNVLVTAANVVKVTDFGIAKILGVSARTRTGVATGSLPFMAPEQIRSGVIDGRTDIYQLGVTIFELAAGRRPFTAETEYEMMTLHLEAPPPRPSSINPRIPEALDAVILKALAKNPDERFATAAAFGGALTAAIAGTSQIDAEETRIGATLPPPRPAPQVTPQVTPPVSRPAPPPPPHRRESPPPSAQPAPVAVPVLPTPQARRRMPWILAGGLVIAALVVVWWFGLRKAPTPPVQQARVTVTAQIPAEVALDRVAAVILKTNHPDVGNSTDTIRAVDGSIRHVLTFAPAPWATFAVEGYDSDNEPLFEGRAERDIPASGDVSLHVPLYATPSSQIAQAEDHHPPETVRVVETQPAATQPEETPGGGPSHNLVIDFLPFSARATIGAFWIDGTASNDPFPLQTTLRPGRHTIQWQIGENRWTDTVTVGQSGVTEKRLFPETGLGRLNISATFSGAAGYADILIDGIATGKGTPYEFRSVAVGPHEVTVVREGFRMRGGPRIVRVQLDDRTRVEIEMIPE